MNAPKNASATKKATPAKKSRATKKPRATKKVVAAVAAIATWRIVVLCAVMAILPSALALHLARIQVVPNQERGFSFLQKHLPDFGKYRLLEVVLFPVFL